MSRGGLGIRRIDTASIVVGDRRREDYGDIDALARSIQQWGMLHPIIVDEYERLIAGERRLRAAQQLGWKQVDVRYFDDLTDDEKRAIELEENLHRKDLTPAEQSKKLVSDAIAVAETISSNLEEKDSRGRKSVYGVPKQEIANALGVGVAELVRAEQHAAAVEEFRGELPQIVDAAQSVAIEYAKAVKEDRALRGQPIAVVVKATPKKVSVPLDPIGAATTLILHFKGDDLRQLIDALARYLPVDAV
jgi:ParB family chromosome partitioning protein